MIEKKAIYLFLFLTALLFPLAIPACHPPQYTTIAGEGIGTYYRITYYDTLQRNAKPAVDSILDAISRLYSVYDSLSLLSRFNRSPQGIDAPQLLPLMQKSIALHGFTEGYFDPTIGPLAKLWGFDGAERAAPDSMAIMQLQNQSCMANLAIRNDSLIKKHPNLTLTLNAIAKGYAVDRIAEHLQQLGIKNHLVEVGGEIRTAGLSPRRTEWIIGIETPIAHAMPGQAFTRRLQITNAAVATSGNYRKFIQANGKTWGHTIDPTTGYPAATPLLSATVIDSSCTRADALATALMAMGVQRAKELIEKLPQTEALLIYRDSTDAHAVWASPAITKRILD